MVWLLVAIGMSAVLLVLEWRRAAAAQDEIEAIAERILGLRDVEVEAGDETIARGGVGHEVEDGIERQQRVAREIHLRHQPRGEAGAEQRVMDVIGPPGVVVVTPGIGAGLDRCESISPLTV